MTFFFKYSFFCSIDNYNMYKEAKTLVAPRPPEKPEKFLLVSRDMTCSFRKLQGKAVLLLCAIYLFFFAACMPRRWLGWNVCVVCCWPHRLNWRGRGLWCRPWIFLLTIRMYKGLTVPTLLSNKCFHTLLVFSFSSNLFQSVSFWLSPKKSTGIKMFV